MTLKQHPETNVLSPGRKAGRQPDEAGDVGEPGQVRPQVSAEAGTNSDDASSRQPEQPASGRRKLNADQITLLLVALLLAVAIVVAAVILSKNL